MKIVLTGASGFIGRNLHALLAAQGHEVRGLSRSQGAHFAQLQTVAAWRPWLKQADAVINAVGIIGQTWSQRFDAVHTGAPRALFDACQEMGVRRVVQISALGADDRAFSHYHLSKKAADDHLRQLDLDWFVLRPSLIYGLGGTSAQVFLHLSRLPVVPVVEQGQQQIEPVHIADVVASVIRCLTASQSRCTLDVTGSEIIDFAGWLQRLRSAQGFGPLRVLSVPRALALWGASLAQPLHPMLRPENVRMLLASPLGDSRSWQDFMGRQALSYTPERVFQDAMQVLSTQGV